MNTEESEPAKSREGGNHDYELNRLIKSGTLMDALLPLLLAWLTWNNLGRQLLDNGSLIHLMLNTNGCEATRRMHGQPREAHVSCHAHSPNSAPLLSSLPPFSLPVRAVPQFSPSFSFLMTPITL